MVGASRSGLTARGAIATEGEGTRAEEEAGNPEREPREAGPVGTAAGAAGGAKRGAQRLAAETRRSPPGRPPVEPKAERRGFLEPGTPEQRRQRRTEERGSRRLEKAVQKRERLRLEP